MTLTIKDIGKFFLAVSVMLLMVISCSKQVDSKNFDLVLEINEKEVLNELTKRLDKDGINYIQVNATTIKYSSNDYKEFNKISKDVVTNDLPGGRAVTFEIPGYNEKLIQEFNKQKIEYVVKYRRGKKWIVWNKNDLGKGNEIVDKLTHIGSREDPFLKK